MAVAVETTVGADGPEDAVGGWIDVGGLLDNVSESEAEIAFAGGEESPGMGVAIDGAPFNAVVTSNVPRIDPVKEFLLDGVALRVIADGAVALVMVARSGNRGSSCDKF